MERTEFFDDKMINKSNLYKNKRLFDIYDIDVSNILISKKNPNGKNAHSNTLLDIRMIILLDHYV